MVGERGDGEGGEMKDSNEKEPECKRKKPSQSGEETQEAEAVLGPTAPFQQRQDAEECYSS